MKSSFTILASTTRATKVFVSTPATVPSLVFPLWSDQCFTPWSLVLLLIPLVSLRSGRAPICSVRSGTWARTTRSPSQATMVRCPPPVSMSPHPWFVLKPYFLQTSASRATTTKPRSTSAATLRLRSGRSSARRTSASRVRSFPPLLARPVSLITNPMNRVPQEGGLHRRQAQEGALEGAQGGALEGAQGGALEGAQGGALEEA
jgi:hypothetical protein